MNRGAFSLFQWTLRRDVQLLRTHLARGAFTGVMKIVLLVAWMRALSVGAAGLNLFESICWMNIIVSTLAGISYFATSVTEESEAGNLGLLKLAGMGSFSIVMGKSTSRLVGALMMLVVQFPFTLLAITLGGVTFVQIVSAYAAIGAHLILVANLALFFSVFSQSSGRAAAWTAVVLGLFFASSAVLTMAATAIPTGPLLGPVDGLMVRGWIENWDAFYHEFSVVDRVTAALQPAFAGPILTSQVAYALVISSVLFCLACLGFEKSTLRQSAPQRASRSGKRRSFRRMLGVSRAWKNAIAWKEFTFLTGGRVMWVLRLVLLGVLSYLIYVYGRGPGTTDWAMVGSTDWALVGSTLSSCLLVMLTIEILVYASRMLFDESRWGTFPLLLILPTTPRNIVWQKTWGCLLATLPGFGWLCLAVWVYPDNVREGMLASRLDYFAVNFLLLVHFTVLLSLFLRWAAIPAAVCAVFAFNSCCPVMAIGLVVADLSGESGGIFVVLISLLTYWILLLLPLQVEIVSRVEDAANHEYGN